jgi:hypothetical protein
MNKKIKDMLELQKFVLQRVYDDAKLFKRELVKSVKWLSQPDIEKLRQWVQLEFGYMYSDIIEEVFCTAQ